MPEQFSRSVHICFSIFAVCLSFVMSSNPRRLDSTVSYSNYGPGQDCQFEGRVVPHGEIYTDPSSSQCLLHQCYFGSSFIVSEGCEDGSGGCHPVGAQWEESCVTYTCTKTAIGGYNYYQPIVKHARCQDSEGQCHDQGERFTYILRGRRYPNCRCNVSNRRILYRCY